MLRVLLWRLCLLRKLLLVVLLLILLWVSLLLLWQVWAPKRPIGSDCIVQSAVFS
jgi:hypothetical protein